MASIQGRGRAGGGITVPEVQPGVVIDGIRGVRNIKGDRGQ